MVTIEIKEDDATPTIHFLDDIHQRRDSLMFLSTRDRIGLAVVMLFLIAAEIALIIGQGTVAAEQLECAATSASYQQNCNWNIIRFKVSFVVIGAVAKVVIEFLSADANNDVLSAYMPVVNVIWYRFPHLCVALGAQTIGMLTMSSMHNAPVADNAHSQLYWNIVTYLFGYSFVAIFTVLLVCRIINGAVICKRMRKRMRKRAQLRMPPQGMPMARSDTVAVM